MLAYISGLAIGGRPGPDGSPQNAADTAALAGALCRIKGKPPIPCAYSMAAANGYTSDGVQSQVEVYTCDMTQASCGAYAGNSDYVQVILTTHGDTFFSRLLRNLVDVRKRVHVEAIAGAQQSGQVGLVAPPGPSRTARQWTLSLPSWLVWHPAPVQRPPKATRTPAATLPPTPTSTPGPPLVAHAWTQSEPLIVYGNVGGLVARWEFYDYPMRFTLLPNGDVYLPRYDQLYQLVDILTTRLSRQATCNLLNSIDRTGLFDADPDMYQMLHSLPDAGTLNLSVHAWRAFPAGPLLDGLPVKSEPDFRTAQATGYCPACAGIDNAIRLLDQYQPPGTLEPLKPARLGVWFQTMGGLGPNFPNDDSILWPLHSNALEAAANAKQQSSSNSRDRDTRLGYPPMILTGADATRVYDALGKSFRLVTVREAGKRYWVFARPLLPNEFNTSPLPTVSLSCLPSDGWHHAP